MTAARCPPRSEPANNHDFLPSAIPRNARSAALLVRQMRPSSRKRANDNQRGCCFGRQPRNFGSSIYRIPQCRLSARSIGSISRAFSCNNRHCLPRRQKAGQRRPDLQRKIARIEACFGSQPQMDKLQNTRWVPSACHAPVHVGAICAGNRPLSSRGTAVCAF